jgi:hypothetical protein
LTRLTLRKAVMFCPNSTLCLRVANHCRISTMESYSIVTDMWLGSFSGMFLLCIQGGPP